MKVSHLILIALVLLLSTAAGSWAATRSIPITGDENQITLLDASDDALHYRIQVGELTAMDVVTKQGPFTRLILPGFHSSQEEGAPELPMMNRLIDIPVGGHARIEVIRDDARMIDLAEFGVEHPLFPAQPSMPKNADPETWPFVYNQDSYAVARVARDLGAVVPIGRMRAADIGRLEIAPVEYFPGSNQIRVHENIELRVVFDDANIAADQDLKERLYSPFFEGVYKRLDGYRTPHTDHPDHVRDVVTMVVVTPSSYRPYLQEFIDWKTQRGFNMIVGVMGTPEVGSTTTSIQAYIRGLYNNPAPGYQAPSFVLFVGDVEQVPSFSGSGITDRPYCAIDADVIPDIYYGRFPAATTTQLQNMLDKTMMYDQFTMPNPAYLGEVVMIAGYDSGHGSTWGNGQINYGTSQYFNAAHGIFSHTHLYPQSGSDDALIVQEVSDGCAYVNYTAHGSETSWSDPTFTQANVRSLQNAGEYCLAVGNCCLAMSFDEPECFGETWLREANKGAIGYIGGSNSTYWDEDYFWGVGYRSSIVANPVYDANALGAYDGIFHDHGEAMDQWYVTNDAIVFCGNLAVVQSGSSRINYYWDIYGLLGDPSISTYLGVPAENSVVHPSTIFTTWSSVTVEAVPNSYVGITKNGEIIAAGTVGASGAVDLPFVVSPLMPGTAQIVVMAQNREPYIENINVIVPATVYIDPVEIQANVTAAVSVGVFEYDGVTPKPGIEVWADGLGYESDHAFTAANGYCTLSVTYPFGPSVDIVGKDPAEPWELFREAIVVRAMPLTAPNLRVTTNIGLADTFALNLEGNLIASGLDTGCELWAFLNDELVGSTSARTLTLTPNETGIVTGIISKSGYNVYSEYFPVIEAYGTLSGHVDANGSPATGAVVRGYDGDMELVFTATTNASGNYTISEEQLVQSYTITCDLFGYLHWEQAFFLNYGANTLDISLELAPAGVITGVITEAGTGLPLQATIKIYRTDTGALYAQTTSDPADGSYTTPALTYFDYSVNVKAWHHIPANVTVTINQPSLTMDFALEPTIGDLLVINDSAKEKSYLPKYDEKTGMLIAPGGMYEEGKAAADIVADLEDLGYTVTLEDMDATDPQTWESYDLLIVSCGANGTTLENATFRAALQSFVLAGGHLLVEGGEVGYDWQSADIAFSRTVLRVEDWLHDTSGNVTNIQPTHYVMSVPNTIPTPITMTSPAYADEDALLQAAGATKIGSWTTYPTDASIIVADNNPAPEGGQYVMFAFNYSKMDAAVRPLLLENAVIWLMTPEFGTCSASGRAIIEGQSDFSGIKVEATPGGGYMYTDETGAFSFEGLFAGTYTFVASKTGWAADTEPVTLQENEHRSDVFLMLSIPVTEQCRQPNLAIGDNMEITDTMPVAMGETIANIEVYVNITHTYIGDLTVWLVSPSGTSVSLHNRTGSGTDNLIGWYPTELTPAQSLNGFVGQPTDGNWVLHVRDNAGGDTGRLNSWCLRITPVQSGPSDVASATPKALALRANRPNPVRGITSIAFDLPKAGPVELAIFDVTGRQVKSLISSVLNAGSYETTWRGTDENGDAVSSAVYFYRLRANGETITRKMMVID